MFTRVKKLIISILIVDYIILLIHFLVKYRYIFDTRFSILIDSKVIDFYNSRIRFVALKAPLNHSSRNYRRNSWMYEFF